MSDTTTATPKGSMDAALVKSEAASLEVKNYAIVPKTLDEMLRFAKWCVASELLPDAIKTPAQALVVMQRGGELGFPGLAAFDVLYIVHGRVRITPAGVKAKALASGLIEDFREDLIGTGDERKAVITIKRKGVKTPIVGTFSVADAKTAKLWGKVGPRGPSAWVTFPDRMLLARARGFAFGDAFPDLVAGLQVREVYDHDPDDEDALAAAASAPSKDAAAPPPPDDLLAGAPETVIEAEFTAQPPQDPLVTAPEAQPARTETPNEDSGSVGAGAAGGESPVASDAEQAPREPEGCKHGRALMALMSRKPGKIVVCEVETCMLELRMATLDDKTTQAQVNLPEKGWTAL